MQISPLRDNDMVPLCTSLKGYSEPEASRISSIGVAPQVSVAQVLALYALFMLHSILLDRIEEPLWSTL